MPNLYVSLALIGALVVVSIATLGFFLRRASRRNDFPAGTWDSFLEEGEGSPSEEEEAGVEKISGGASREEVSLATPPAPAGESGAVEHIAGPEAAGDGGAPSSFGGTGEAPPVSAAAPDITPPGAGPREDDWWKGIPAPADVPPRRTVAQLMGMAVAEAVPHAEGSPAPSGDEAPSEGEVPPSSGTGLEPEPEEMPADEFLMPEAEAAGTEGSEPAAGYAAGTAPAPGEAAPAPGEEDLLEEAEPGISLEEFEGLEPAEAAPPHAGEGAAPSGVIEEEEPPAAEPEGSFEIEELQGQEEIEGAEPAIQEEGEAAPVEAAEEAGEIIELEEAGPLAVAETADGEMRGEIEDLSPELEELEPAGEVEMLPDPEERPPAAGAPPGDVPPTGEEELAFGGGREEIPLELEEGEVLLSDADMEEEAEPELLTVEEEKDDVFTVLEKEREGEEDFGGEIESVEEREAVSGAEEAPAPPAEEAPVPPAEEIPGLSEEDEPSAVWADEALTRDVSPEEGEPIAAALDAPPGPPAAGEGAAFTPEEREAAPGSAALPEAPAEGAPFEKVSVLLAALVPGDVLSIEGEEAGLPDWAAALADEASADLQGREGERPPPEGGEYLRLGILEYLLGRSDGATDRLKKALRLSSDLGSVLNALAVATYARGRIDPAISYCREGLREAGGDPVLEAALWRNLGFLYQAKGDLAPAAEAYVFALGRMDPDADTLLCARLHTRAGQIIRRLGDPRRGEEHLSEAVNLYRKGGDEESRIRALVALSSVQSDLGSFGPSLKSLEEAAALCASTGDVPGEALVLGQMGIAYAAQDQHTRALSHYEKALAAHRELGNRKGEAAMLSNIGNIHYFRDDLDEAFSAYEGALAINREEEHPIGIATSLGNLGRLNLEKRDLALAREQLTEARDIFKEAGAQAQLETVRGALEDLDQTEGASPAAS